MLRQRKALIAAATAVALVGGSSLGYRWITSSRPVSAASAVARFRAEHEAAAATQPPVKTATAPVVTVKAVARRTGGVARAEAHHAAAPRPAPAPKGSWFVWPSSGVYTFATTGYEKATFSRNYPSQTQRIIDTSHGSYENHHIFSQEHEEWFTLRPTSRGGEMMKRRIRVTFGPVTVDQTVTFDPGIVGVPVPYKLGEVWKGSWKGDTSGTYTGKTLDHRTIRVGAEDVEVWVEELTLHMQGKVSGTAVTKLWYAPKLGMDAREDGMYDMRSQGTPGTYHTEYTITLSSTHPQR